jgi:hypothetical protein
MINLTREEAQQVMDALVFSTPSGDGPAEVYKDAVVLLQNRLAKETPYEVGQRLHRQGLGISDIPTDVYSDGDIAEAYRGFEDARLAQPEPEPVAWKVWTVHNHIFFSIGVQTFQINDVLEHEPEVSAEEFSEWLATQLRHALTLLSTAPPQREYPDNFIDALKFHTAMQEPEPEPVAWMEIQNYLDEENLWCERKVLSEYDNGRNMPLYTTPPQREWQGLTDEDIGMVSDEFLEGAIWADARLKEKNT